MSGPGIDAYLPVIDLTIGDVYELQSRNLAVGVYAGNGAFIGIREKFGSSYLDTEHHYDTSDRYGTARPMRRIGRINSTTALVSHLEPECGVCHRPVKFSKTDGWRHTDGNPAHDVAPVSRINEELHTALQPLDTRVRAGREASQHPHVDTA